MRTDDRDGTVVLFIDPGGPLIATSNDTSDLIGNAWMTHADVIAVPVERLDPAFFRLSTLFAGDLTQKVVNYHLRLAVIGDVTAWERESDAFRDFVWESNRGDHIWFVPDEAALDAKLAPRRAAHRLRSQLGDHTPGGQLDGQG